jgi:hypothetical protein
MSISAPQQDQKFDENAEWDDIVQSMGNKRSNWTRTSTTKTTFYSSDTSKSGNSLKDFIDEDEDWDEIQEVLRIGAENRREHLAKEKAQHVLLVKQRDIANQAKAQLDLDRKRTETTAHMLQSNHVNDHRNAFARQFDEVEGVEKMEKAEEQPILQVKQPEVPKIDDNVSGFERNVLRTGGRVPPVVKPCCHVCQQCEAVAARRNVGVERIDSPSNYSSNTMSDIEGSVILTPGSSRPASVQIPESPAARTSDYSQPSEPQPNSQIKEMYSKLLSDPKSDFRNSMPSTPANIALEDSKSRFSDDSSEEGSGAFPMSATADLIPLPLQPQHKKKNSQNLSKLTIDWDYRAYPNPSGLTTPSPPSSPLIPSAERPKNPVPMHKGYKGNVAPSEDELKSLLELDEEEYHKVVRKGWA